MKGDFTRLTFRRDKHYTSVRMQQGRLQLDSDWNEQAEIQAHLYRTQVVDLIGAASGAPTSDNDPNQKTDQAYKDSFKIGVTSDRKDLMIAPGHFYVNGTLCELEATPVNYSVSSPPSERVTIDTLIVDGRKFEADQWVKVQDDRILKIQAGINTQTLELPLSDIVNQAGQLNRIVTYKTQANYPNPEYADQDAIADGLYLVYLDVWQRHITAVEDSGLREVALNIPDTTTRTQTVWQVKLRKFDRSLIQSCSSSETEAKELLQRFNSLIDGFSNDLNNFETVLKGLLPAQVQSIDDLIAAIRSAPSDSKNNLTQQFTQLIASLSDAEKDTAKQAFDPLTEKLQTDPKTFNADVQDLIQRIKKPFPGKDNGRTVFMNACAKLCPVSGGMTASDNRYRRLENQLYRVEIHDPGKVGDDPSNAQLQKATFKWSRDNGSIVSRIENNDRFEKGIIVICKSAQDAWGAAKSGQWIEILNEERELKGQPGRLARLNRVFGNTLEFDVASLVGEAVPNPTKVRLWDHMTKEAAILTRVEWTELEAGIKVHFKKDNDYKTGDYWVIPARATINEIEWSNDQAEDLNKRQPLPQSALGIQHDYALLAVVAAANGEFIPPKDDAEDEQQDQRFIFPALAYTFDTREGVIQGNLEVKGKLTANNLNITGKFSANTFEGSVFQIARNPTTDTPEPFGVMQLNNTDIEFKAESSKNANFKFTDGNVAIAKNLQVDGKATVIQDFQVSENATIAKKTTTDSLQVNQNVVVSQNAQINGDVTIAKKTTTDSLQVNQNVVVSQNAQINGDATIAKKTTTDSLQVNQNAQIDGNVSIAKKTTTKELQVTTDATVTQKITTESLEVNAGATVGGLEILGTIADPALGVVGNATVTQKTTTESLQVNTDLTLGKAVAGGTLRILGSGGSPGLLEVNQGTVKAEILAAKQLETETIDAETVLVKGSTVSGGYHQISSRAFKEGITDLNSQEVATLLQALNPVRFIYTEDASQSLNLGFIAEDTPDLLTSADKQAVKLMDVVAILTKAVKDQQHELEHLREKLNALEVGELDRSPTIVVPPTVVPEARRFHKRKLGRWFRNLKRFLRHLLTRT